MKRREQIASTDTQLKTGLFNMPSDWEKVWQGMPAFHQENIKPYETLNVHFRNEEDRQAFAKFVGQTLSPKTQYIWWPQEAKDDTVNRLCSAEVPLLPKYPIYVISKGRWESRLTVKALERLHCPFHIVIEPQEHDNYAAVIDPDKILVLPFSNLGQGSIPARNWVWEHSLAQGHKRHWILDDNIRCFKRLYRNVYSYLVDSTCFRIIEELVDRYENVALAGMNYFMFVPRRNVIPPMYLNTRIYSCILIKNDLPYRWRGRYNEDTDLSLRALKDGWCTILTNAFSAEKIATMLMKGGNTEELYAGDGRLAMAQSLKDQHPDVVELNYKWGRWQHQVDYRPFRRNQLKLRKGTVVRSGVFEYGLRIHSATEDQAEELREIEEGQLTEAEMKAQQQKEKEPCQEKQPRRRRR